MTIGIAAAGTEELALIAAGFLTLYIAAVTHIAAGENDSQRVGDVRLVPSFCLAGLLVLGLLGLPQHTGFCSRTVGLGLWAIAAVLSARQGVLLGARRVSPGVVQKSIGTYIHLLLFWQAGALVAAAYPATTFLGSALLIAWPIARLLSRRFAPS